MAYAVGDPDFGAHHSVSLGEVIDHRDPQWEVVYTFEPVQGQTVLEQIHIRPAKGKPTPRDGLSARLARDLVRPGYALEVHRAWLRLELEKTKMLHDVIVTDATGQFAEWIESKGWRPPTDEAGWSEVFRETAELIGKWQSIAYVPLDRTERLARTAQLYLEARAGGDRAPVQRVAALQERTPSSVRDDVHQARLEGLLTRTRGYGHAGGELTKRAIEVLQEAAS